MANAEEDAIRIRSISLAELKELYSHDPNYDGGIVMDHRSNILITVHDRGDLEPDIISASALHIDSNTAASAYGFGSERAIAFALRKLADRLLDEHPLARLLDNENDSVVQKDIATETTAKEYPMKEANDLLALGQSIADATKSAKSDGHTDWMDLPKFAPVVAKAYAAVQGSDKIDDEIETATPDELVDFAQRAIETALALINALIAK